MNGTDSLMTFSSHEPSSGELIKAFTIDDRTSVDATVSQARLALQSWQALGFDGRKKVLLNWCSLLTENLNELGALIARETGKPVGDATLEASLAIGHLAWAAKSAGRVLKTHIRPSGILMFNMKSQVERSPMGVVGVIGPWNYPVFTPMGSISYALAAGNTVVFKPSQYTPAVGEWLAQSFASIAPFPHVFSVVQGLGETGQWLTTSSVDKISFTGSTRTAKLVAATCAERMIPVVLECGGKDPVIIARDADIDKAAEYVLWSAMSNAGQTCIGAERVYVVNDVADAFIEKISSLAQQLEPGKNYGPATMPSQLNVIQSHIDDAAHKGAKFVLGSTHSVGERYVEPVIMLDVPEDSLAITEETFGPTLTINRTTNIEEAISLANATRYGLAASVWSKRQGHHIASQLQCGMVSINSVIAFAAIASVPFGGVKDSGYGRIHGPEGLLEFTYPRTVISPRFKIPVEFTTFARTRFADNFIKTLIKFLHSKVVG